MQSAGVATSCLVCRKWYWGSSSFPLLAADVPSICSDQDVSQRHSRGLVMGQESQQLFVGLSELPWRCSLLGHPGRGWDDGLEKRLWNFSYISCKF